MRLPYLLFPTLLTIGLGISMSSCGHTTEGEVSATSDSGTPDAGQEIAGVQQPAEPMVAPAPAVEPTYHFEPGGPVPDSELGNYYVAMQCAVDGQDVGTMLIELWAEKAPITVRNFLRYCDEGFYNGKTFHRIMRDFMVQGGDPLGTGGGDGPYGLIKGEFSEDPEWGHHYGVLSMARKGGDNDSGSCQIFICNAETASVWGLDGQYASFAKLAYGVSTLEALSNTPVIGAQGGEGSRPTKKVTISKAEVHAGTPPQREEIERPQPDLNGEPATVRVQHVLISFDKTPLAAPRTKEEAEVLAAQILERARKGESMTKLVREISDDPAREGDPAPGTYAMTNTGAFDSASERGMYELSKQQVELQERLTQEVDAGTLDQAGANTQMKELNTSLQAQAQKLQVLKRGSMVKSFGDVAFSLAVGEVGIANFNEADSPFGWHIIKRID